LDQSILAKQWLLLLLLLLLLLQQLLADHPLKQLLLKL
jgi:hypothetical protein